VEKAVTTASATLRDGFDLEMIERPIWRKVEKTKWQSPNGFSYSGQLGAHVANSKTSLLGTTHKTEMALLSHETTHRSPKNIWNIVSNEDKPGENPYPGGHLEVAQTVIERK